MSTGLANKRLEVDLSAVFGLAEGPVFSTHVAQGDNYFNSC
jgi:hypothetical protein